MAGVTHDARSKCLHYTPPELPVNLTQQAVKVQSGLIEDVIIIPQVSQVTTLKEQIAEVEQLSSEAGVIEHEKADNESTLIEVAAGVTPELALTASGQYVINEPGWLGPLFTVSEGEHKFILSESSPSVSPADELLASVQLEPTFLSWEDKYLYPGPAPLGRIFNYVHRIIVQDYTTISRGPRNPSNLDQWTVCAMTGLGLVERIEETGLPLCLTEVGQAIAHKLASFEPFPENDNIPTLRLISNFINIQDKTLFADIRATFCQSPALQTLCQLLQNFGTPLKISEFYTYFVKWHDNMTRETAEHRLPSLIKVAQFCGLLGYDQTTHILNLMDT
jgi:hypothetical protein